MVIRTRDVELELKQEVGKVKEMLSRCGKKIRFRSAIGTIQSFIDILLAGTNILHISCHGNKIILPNFYDGDKAIRLVKYSCRLSLFHLVQFLTYVQPAF